MRIAHQQGMRTTATMMFGLGETYRQRVEHLVCIRQLQDETGGFTAFIPWTFQPAHTQLAHLQPASGHQYLRTLAVARLFLDNIANVQASYITQGEKVGQMALFFGANDMGSTMLEENVVRAAGVDFRLSRERLEHIIARAGFRPLQRDCYYNIIGARPAS
jgi:cyclic dehypoxanthinyl futalosine synthase